MVRNARMAGLALCLTGILLSSGCDDESPVDVLTDPGTMPEVVFTLPANGSTGPYKLFAPGNETNQFPHFVVRFNKLIRLSSISLTSVTASGLGRPVQVYPYRDYYPIRAIIPSRTTESANDLYDVVVSFQITDSATYRQSSYDVGQVITIAFDSTIEDINGNHLRPFSFSYRPEPAFRVVSTEPKNGSEDVQVYLYYLSVNFNTRVTSDIFSALAVNPGLPGSWNLSGVDSTAAYFIVEDDWAYATRYAVSVSPSAHDRRGNILGQPYTSEFTTIAFRVLNATPKGTSVPPSTVLDLSFTGTLDSGSVRSAFSINPAADGIFRIYYLSSGFTYSPAQGLAPNTAYTVSVAASLRALDGTALSAPYSYSFTTDSFRIAFTDPMDGYVNVPRSTTIHIHGNAQLDVSSVQGALAISPAVSGSVSGFQGQPGTTGYITFYPSAPLSARTTYAVTVKTNLMTATGHLLLRPYTFSFTTGD